MTGRVLVPEEDYGAQIYRVDNTLRRRKPPPGSKSLRHFLYVLKTVHRLKVSIEILGSPCLDATGSGRRPEPLSLFPL